MARSLVAGGGIGVLYCVVGDATDGVVRVFEEPVDEMEIGIVYHRSMRGSARLRAVLDLLVGFHVCRRDAFERAPAGQVNRPRDDASR